MTTARPGETGYRDGSVSFLAGLKPQDAVAMSFEDALELLRARYGPAVDVALSEPAVDLSRPLAEVPEAVRSPRAGHGDSSWMRTTNMVGVNVRTVGDYAGVITYAMTLPAAFDSIHLLPVWEPGVVESLYGIAGWNLNTRFFSPALQHAAPHLDTVGTQLRAVSNLLHVMGKTIGMDVIPHTDRFSEAAAGTPDLFEWMRIEDDRIVDRSESLSGVVEASVHAWLRTVGPAAPELTVPDHQEHLFALPEDDRLALLFGSPSDLHGRTERRVELIKHLKATGLEPVPATMGVPFRGIRVDTTNVVVDRYSMEWPDYVITAPEPMSRVFSPLARFKLYGRRHDNAEWEIDFDHPRHHVWEYVCRHYARTQHIGNFDFMRGDMSHVQMRPGGVPEVVDDRYDILAAVKTHIQERASAPWFGYFAESFLPPRDLFGFGEELDHLDASLADATLGDLQSTVVGSPEFLRRFRRYLDDLVTRTCAPAFCVMTADKDDPRFDEFYRDGNEVRMFTALFVTDMPSYTGLGFEVRDVHREPVENERYTKLFVFREEGESNVYPSKARHGEDFIWGENEALFERLTALRRYAETVLPEIASATTRWLVPPDATTERGTAAWTQADGASHLFVANYDLEAPAGYFGIPGLDPECTLHLEFSTAGPVPATARPIASNGFFHRIERMGPAEGRVYRVAPGASPAADSTS